MKLDDIDRGILYLLQHDARRLTTTEMADRVNVSASTVQNRIDRLEETDIIRGYHPDIDYDKAGSHLYVEIVCRAPNPKREQLAQKASEVSGVVAIREVLNGEENMQIDAVGTNFDNIAQITAELSALGLTVVDTKLVKDTVVQPFTYFKTHGAGVWKMTEYLSGVEDSLHYDPETGIYRATFDIDAVDPSIAVIDMIAMILKKEPTAVDPVYDFVDLSSLDKFLTPPADETQTTERSATFSFHDLTITVSSSGHLTVDPSSAEDEQ